MPQLYQYQSKRQFPDRYKNRAAWQDYEADFEQSEEGLTNIMPREPAKPKTFNLNSTKDHVAKLDRELKRLEGASSPEAAIDHGTNAAMTAWHLSDWVWMEISRAPKKKVAASRILGLNVQDLNLKKFQGALRKQCVEIQYCEGVSVSTKHFGFDRDIDFKTDITSATVKTENSGGAHSVGFEFSELGTKITYGHLEK